MKNQLLSFVCITLLLYSCNHNNNKLTAPELTQSGLKPNNFRTEISEEPVNLYTLKNLSGMEVCITNFGGRIVSIMVPDRNGVLKDVVLGFDNIDDYINIPNDFGASIGRYANRIKNGKMVIDGRRIQLPQNNFGHSLHGGPKGWQYRVYKANQTDEKIITLMLVSPDGDANYPGKVTVTVTYTLTDDNAIDIKYKATTNRKTIINMTNHSYFNLSGDATKPVIDDSLYINASNYTPIDSTFITTGEIFPVEGTPMDFRETKRIGDEIDNYDFEQLKNANGYDHNWVLDTNGDIRQLAAKLTSPESGISLEVYTNEPGIQVYTGNFLDGTVTGKNDIIYNRRAAVCLETQHYPDSPNKPNWPSVILKPGQTYNSHCIYKFTTE